MRRLRSAALVVLVALVLPVGALAHGRAMRAGAGHAVGEQRVLVVPVTWGPQPFTVERVREVVFGETNAFMQAASFGRMSLVGDVTPWLPAFKTEPPCDPQQIRTVARAAASEAGFDPARYARFVYLFPRNACPWAGLGGGAHAYLNGALYRKLVAHELGHTYGLGHANSWECVAGACGAVEYGDLYDTMGGGTGHFNAFEKSELDWIQNVARPAAPGTYAIDALEQPTARPQALVITTASHEYWLDHRLEQVPFRLTQSFLPTGVFVHVGPNPSASPGALVFMEENLLLPDPAGQGRAALFPGETFSEPGVFELTVVRQEGQTAELRFAWTDRTVPRAPVLTSPAAKVRAGRGEVLIAWREARETGSGVAYYEVTLDGRRAARVEVAAATTAVAWIRRPAPGTHRIAVVAVDRAGNRSAAGVRTFRVVHR